MTDPKSRVQLAQELLSGGLPMLATAVADLRNRVVELNPGLLPDSDWLRWLRRDLDERETQLHPIARAHPQPRCPAVCSYPVELDGTCRRCGNRMHSDPALAGHSLPPQSTAAQDYPAPVSPPPGWYMCEACERNGATVNLLEGGEPWARVCQPCSLDEGVAKGRIRDRRAKTAALASPGDDKRELPSNPVEPETTRGQLQRGLDEVARALGRPALLVGEHADAVRTILTHEGATAAEWASRYADAELRAKTWKGEYEREAKAAREGRVQASNLQAELVRLEEENARLSAAVVDAKLVLENLDSGMDERNDLAHELRVLVEDDQAAAAPCPCECHKNGFDKCEACCKLAAAPPESPVPVEAPLMCECGHLRAAHVTHHALGVFCAHCECGGYTDPEPPAERPLGEEEL